MIGPSPDWIVGVSGLELCRTNCSWAESKELFLYPWDAGVDGGISYESPDSPTEPQLPITRITSRLPDDPRQPFWNETGAPMKPLAKLTVNRQRLYRKSCNDDDAVIPFSEGAETDFYDEKTEPTSTDQVTEDHTLPGCEATAWSSWSDCSVTCGKGISMRTRSFALPDKAKMLGCDRQMIQKEMCSALIPLCEGDGFYVSAPEDFLPDDMCATSEWSKWSECSTTCGKGFESRVRRFFNRMGRKKCPHVETIEKRMCAGRESVCPQQEQEQVDPHCAVTSWSDWSPCSVSCGKGLKVRTRLYMVSPQQQTSADCNVLLMEKADCEGPRPKCEFNAKDARFICNLPKEEGPCRGYFPRWYFDDTKKICVQFLFGGCRGNSNNFDRYDDCMKVCEMQAQMSIFSDDHGQDQDEEDEEQREQLPTKSFLKNQKSASSMMKKKMPEDANNEELDIEEEFLGDEYEAGGSDDVAVTVDDVHDDHGAGDQFFPSHTIAAASHLRNLDFVGVVGETKEERKIRMMKEERRRQMERMAEQQRPASADEVSTLHPPVDCLITAWSPWSACSATCGKGFRRKFRMVKRHPTPGGKKCPKKLEKKQKCRLPICYQDCILGDWQEWSPCSQSCGSDGVQERLRQVDNPAKKGGRACDPKVERRICILAECNDS